MSIVRLAFVLILVVCPFLLSPAYGESAAEGMEYARGLSSAFARAAADIMPSVVNITTTKKMTMGKLRGQTPDPYLQPFLDFFGDDLFRHFAPPPGAPQEGPVPQGMGTGVIIDKEGHIVTNNHVIGEADDVRVRLKDGRTLKAKIVGTDPRSDLAVIKIDVKDLAAARIGDSDKLQIGEWVIAAGNPFGLEDTITTGIVSAKGRSISGGNQYEDYIQTDAAINPGNSGGPLLNLDGEVVGINTAIFSRSGGYMGIGFAIPINMAKGVMSSLIKEGRVVRGWLGIGIQNLTKELAQSFNYQGTEGALVGHLEQNSPARKAGIQQGDIIISYNGQPVSDTNQLRNAVAATRPGTSVTLDVIRDGRKKTVSVEVGELPAQPNALEPRKEATSDLGVSIETLTPEQARRMGAHARSGVLVLEVLPGSLAARAALQRGDIIVSVDGVKIKNTDEFTKRVTNEKLKQGVRLLVESQGMERFVFLKAEE